MTDTWFDPNLYIPEGLKGAQAAPVDEVTLMLGLEPYEAQENIYDDGESLRDDETTDDDEYGLYAPDYLTVIEQVLRTAPDGTQTVDVVLEVSDVAGARDYELRVTKV